MKNKYGEHYEFHANGIQIGSLCKQRRVTQLDIDRWKQQRLERKAKKFIPLDPYRYDH